MNIQSYRKEIQKLDDKMIVGGGGPFMYIIVGAFHT